MLFTTIVFACLELWFQLFMTYETIMFACLELSFKLFIRLQVAVCFYFY